VSKRVGINLLWMVPGVVGGSETYLTRLLAGLAARDADFDYTIFALPQFAEAHPDLAQSFEIAYAPLTGQWKSFRVAGENTWLAVQSRMRKIDLVHHAGGTVPFLSRSRPVLTIHDLQYMFYPEYFTRTKLSFLKRMVPRSAEDARLILTPSEYTRRTVIERLHIDPSLVVVVPHGISPEPPGEPASDIADRYEIGGPFFIYPAATYPHKNHLVLLNGFARLLKMHPDAYLVFTGAKAWMEWRIAKEMGRRIDAETDALGIDDRVKRLGYIPGRDLEALYQSAAALVFPSRFEGFGAPVLEAMTRSCPVIAADATALPEVVQDAGMLVSPDNPEHWANAMAEVLEDKDLRVRLVKTGIERAKEFSWDRSAEILEDAYAHALGTTL
jgi:glycosyltransferase involved in cell wall biosynthesis